jgi:N-acetylglutamate synthase-like GNAT family acetyltransferase
MTDTISMRLATVLDHATLEALQWRASLMWEEDRDALLSHSDAIEIPIAQLHEGRVIVAEKNGTIAGFAVVLPRKDESAELDGLFVDPGRWRTGIGTRLIQAATAKAVADGADFLYVVGNPRAAEFYYACGFVLTGREQTRFGIGLSLRKSCGA